MKELLYATNNPGKHQEVGRFLAQYNIKTLSPKDLKLDIDPEESGSSLEENALIKCRAFLDALKYAENIIVVADDTGVEIDALNGEPGIHVHRWKDHQHRMQDQEIIDYAIERMQNIPKDERGAQFKTVIAIGVGNQPIQTFAGILRGEIVEQPIPLKMEGFPFESIFYIPKFKAMLGDIHQMSTAKKEELDFHSHRERAFINALPTIQTLINS